MSVNWSSFDPVINGEKYIYFYDVSAVFNIVNVNSSSRLTVDVLYMAAQSVEKFTIIKCSYTAKTSTAKDKLNNFSFCNLLVYISK